MKLKNILFSILLLSGLLSCTDKSKENLHQNGQLKVTFNAATNMIGEQHTMQVKSRSSNTDESKVENINLFVFDQETRLLEIMESNIPTNNPTGSNVLGEMKIGELIITLPDSKPKHILAIANESGNRVVLPALKEGVTTYDEMLVSIAQITSENELVSPFVMTGYANIKSGDTEATVTFKRLVSKLTVINKGISKGLSISSLQLINVPDKAALFQETMPNDYSLIDYDVRSVSENSSDFYLYPVKKEVNKIKLRIEGKIKEQTFTHELEVKPYDSSNSLLDIKSNHKYSISLDIIDESMKLKTGILLVEDWIEEEDMTVLIPDDGNDKVELIKFNGLLWADRNLGATNNDLEADWENSIGLFYQWGRNIGFSMKGYETISGPLSSLNDANSDENKSKFIFGGFRDWLTSSNNTLWQTYDTQPCSDDFRLPTEKELLGIFTARGAITNMVTGPKIVTDEVLVNGVYTAHYWGDDRNKRVYGIKCQGTDNAYYMKWEYLKTKEGNPYLKISRWDTNRNATFASKTMTEVREEFEAFPSTNEILILPGAGYITGSNGEYNKSEGGYYWSSSLTGDNKVYRAEFNTGRMSMTEPYASRISGHTIRCVSR